MKRELKHLAPYLPYGLMIHCDFNDGDVLNCKMEGITTEEAFLDGCDWDYKTNMDFNPILRPLSQLTEKIEINGEVFIPIVELLKIEHEKFHNDKENTRYSEIFSEMRGNRAFACFQLMATMDISLNISFPWNFPLWICDRLYKWHFDVNGLIEKGLAKAYE